jgi:orotidine-5'-phosphate decarboxylase
MADVSEEIRGRLALSLDVADLDTAVELAKRLRPWFGVAKIGMELHGAAGPAAVESMHDLGYAVFLDLKLHDIPTTVGRACAVHARRGVEYLNVHASGGPEMLDAAVGAIRDAGSATKLLAVTVLTSDPDVRAFDTRFGWALAARCDGVVCSAHELGAVRSRSPEGFVTMVPGIRLPDSDTNDQARVATPAEAIEAGASCLVIGRTVTHAADPEAAAARLVATLS